MGLFFFFQSYLLCQEVIFMKPFVDTEFSILLLWLQQTSVWHVMEIKCYESNHCITLIMYVLV